MLPLFLIAATVAVPACKPQTTGQKIEDKAEDAGHNMGQAAERAGENVNDATK
jgi:hypothetical protein